MPEIQYFNTVDSRDEMIASLKKDGAIIVEDAVGLKESPSFGYVNYEEKESE